MSGFLHPLHFIARHIPIAMIGRKMNEVVSSSSPSGSNALLAPCFNRLSVRLSLKWHCSALKVGSKLSPMKVEAKMANPSTYSSRISTDISLYEIPGASFDEYLEDRPRVFRAIFPDKRRSQQLNEKEWRIHMLPINFLFLTVLPVVDMRLRCKSKGIGYPPQVPLDISKVLELDIIRWELQGLDDMLKPSQFSLDVKGALYPDRRGPRTRLKGQLEINISFALPPMLALVPEDIRRDVADSVLRRLVLNMKDKVNGSLLTDYGEFKREATNALARAKPWGVELNPL